MYNLFTVVGSPGTALCVLGLSYIVAVIVYRLTLHPLAKYPGPLLAKITDWYNVYHCFLGDRHIELYRIHQKYGKFVRYGPNRLSINSQGALKSIYAVQANVQKSSWYSVWDAFFASPSSQSMIDEKKYHHSEKRKVIAQALTDRSLDQMDEVLLEHTRDFCDLLLSSEEDDGATDTQGWSPPRNVQVLLRQLGFDVMGDVCFGQSFQTMKDDTNHYIFGAMKQGGRCLYAAGHMPQIVKSGLHKWLDPALMRDFERFINYVNMLCKRRLASEGSKIFTDVFTAIHGATHPKTGVPIWTASELESETALLILAGSDNTATAMTTTLFYLAHNQPELEEAQAEVRRTFTSFEEIRSGDKLSNCHYVRACIDEALRMSPPAPGLMPRAPLKGGINIDEQQIPEGIEIGTPIYAIQHDPSCYPEPFSFQPKRWLPGAPGAGYSREEDIILSRNTLCAFSKGPRDCVGKQMAYREMMVVLCSILWKFEMQLAPGSTLGEGGQGAGFGRERVNEYQLLDFFAGAGSGPELCFKLRKS